MTQTPNPPFLQLPQSLSSSAAKSCFNCNSDNNWILHNIRIQPGCKKLCTSCVLKLHPTSFCPTCFNLHDPNSLNPLPPSSSSSSSSNHRTLTCLKCNSVSHITCVPPNTPKSPYLCPPCSNPSFKFFDFKKPRKIHHDQPQSDGGGNGGGNGSGGSHSKKVLEDEIQYLDERAARVLLLAAKISTISINKAAAQARTEVERRVREAALARKRAKEAIDLVVSLSYKLSSVKQQQRREVVSGPGSNFMPVKVEKNGGGHNVGGVAGDHKVGNGNGNGNGSVVVVPVPLAVVKSGNNENNQIAG
ncbi:hypothetical protein BVRB_4g079530 [Beta vulgaris subsp. vulgaris]|uniref:uncharacterized protein LOC104890637 n=1 Tax=Beta vulgaris subsp. vulgaris TaxID=3555 RepID=UPI00053FD059|nr:uncharacterized protein LOC104890637 [Beta vulgaris subsp. vulgaris]KMT14131.1 hypothetical protein BVRB_4g079530 [Beta vulgaris subsp. vulgaris]